VKAADYRRAGRGIKSDRMAVRFSVQAGFYGGASPDPAVGSAALSHVGRSSMPAD